MKLAEKRIPTGVRKTTVLDPSTYTGGWYTTHKILEHYSGDPMGIDLSAIQEEHFADLSDILARSGLELEYIGYARYDGEPAYNARNPNRKPMLFRFVMTAPGLVWEKYEGVSAGGGRNTIYVAGEKMKLTHFMSLSNKAQDKLIQADA